MMGAYNAITAVWPGRSDPLGATWDGQGVNFALFSRHAERVELCLFDDKGRHERQRIVLRERTADVWHCYLPQARPGMVGKAHAGFEFTGDFSPYPAPAGVDRRALTIVAIANDGSDRTDK